MSASADYPGLQLLLQGYLNQDWPEEYQDPWAAVADFVQSEPEAAAVLVQEIWAAILNAGSDAELEQLVSRDLGSGYLPPADGWSYLSWLVEVARYVGRR